MSEAMLERAMGGAENALEGETARAVDAVVATERPRVARPPNGQVQPPPYRQHRVDRGLAARQLPRGDLSPFQRWFRLLFSRTVSTLVMKTWFRVKVVNPERFQTGPALYCFNHLSWMDTLLLLCTFPSKPQLYLYGPKQADIHKGGKNRFMWWTGVPVPFSPLKDDMLTSVRRAQAVFDSGGVLGIAPEGAIHVHEGDLLPFEEGAAYLALRAGVPIVPVAITGTSWARFRGQVLLRLGEPIPTGERPTREVVSRYSAWAWHAIRAMVDGDRDGPPPGPIGRWFTDVFNDWGEGGREAASLRRGPDPADVPYGPDDVANRATDVPDEPASPGEAGAD